MPLQTLRPTAHPESGRVRLTDVLRRDLPASLVVFLVAVPLSLGIAVASGAPIASGLIAAAVGGIVAGLLGGSQLQVSGPAAGMVVVVAGLVAQYGWATVCAVTVAAGLLQVALGATGAGRLARAIPPGVVHGMLAGIGLSIALSQLHVVLGGEAASHPLENITSMPADVLALDPASAALGAGTFAVLVLWSRLPARVRAVPGPLVAIGLATIVAAWLGLDVARPQLPSNLLDLSFVPRVEGIGVTDFLAAAVTMALLASVESLLSAVAVDKLHTGPRADLRRELLGQGAANSVSGALGGLPVTGVIVRSSTNAMAGGRTRASAVLHGVWVVVCSALFVGLIESIPLAALGGLLVHVGLKLVDLDHVKDLARHKDLPPYLATLGGVLVLDLTLGVLIGLVTAFVFLRHRASWHAVETVVEGDVHAVRVRGTVGFITVPSLLAGLDAVPTGATARLELDLDYMDHAAITVLGDWIDAHRSTGGTVLLDEGGEPWLSSGRDGAPIVTRTEATGRTPTARWFGSRWSREDRPGSPVLAGVDDFHAHREAFAPTLADLAEGQAPRTLFITCCDSRVVPELITAGGPGDLFTVRSIGNLVPAWDGGALPETGSTVAAAVEYAVGVLGVEEIVVCGHSGCGAMRALVDGPPPGRFDALTHWLEAAGPALADDVAAVRAGTADLDEMSQANVRLQVEHLRAHPVVADALGRDAVRLLGLHFDIATATTHTVVGAPEPVAT